MARMIHSQDRTFYVIRDASAEVDDAVLTTSEDEAFDIWAADTTWEVFAFNPIENWAMPVTDEFRDRLDDEGVEARSMQRHYSAFARAS